MNELELREESKEHEEEYYEWGFGTNKKSLAKKIKLYRRSGLYTVEHRYKCFYKRKGLKRAYRERFVKNILDRIYLFFL